MTTAALSSGTGTRVRLVLLTLVAAILVAGCGSGDGRMSKSEYVDEFNTIQTKLGKALDSAGAASSDPKTATAALEKTVAELDTSIADMKKLEPPTDWQKEHDQMLSALVEIRDAMQQMVGANGDPAVMTTALKKIEGAATKGQAATESINKSR